MHQEKSLYVLGSLVVACSARVERFPRPGESLAAEAFTVEIGGKGFNVAVGARRLGVTVAGLLAVGDDPLSVVATEAVERSGLPPAMLRRFQGATGAGIGFTDRHGETCVAVHGGANGRLGAGDVAADAAAIRASSFTMAQFEIADEPIAEGFRIARTAGARTILNPSPFRPISPEILENTSILICNQGEAAQLAQVMTGSPDDVDGLAALAFAHGLEAVITTRGPEGAEVLGRCGQRWMQPAFPVEVVDTLGAGDAFTAGLLSGLIEGRSVEESLMIAVTCGSLVCRGTGVLHLLPTRAEIDAVMARPPAFC